MSGLQDLHAELNARVQELAHVMERILEAGQEKDWERFEKLAEAMNAGHDKVNAAMQAIGAYECAG